MSHAEVGFVATAPAIHRLLQRTPSVLEVREAFQTGTLSEATIRQFVATLMRDLQPAERFKHDLVIAALAVAIERQETPFAEEFFRDLARLQSAEMSMSIRVARECLKDRAAPAGNHVAEPSPSSPSQSVAP